MTDPARTEARGSPHGGRSELAAREPGRAGAAAPVVGGATAGAWTAGAAAALLAAIPGWPPALHALLLAPALGWVPGALAAQALAPDRGAGWRALLALVLSPLVAGAPAAALLAAGAPAPVAARATLLAVGVAALVAAFRVRGAPPPAPADGRDAAPWAIPALWTAAVAALLVGNPALAPRLDGFFHAAITLEVVERGLSLEDPFFAGLRLLYFWGPHVWAALWLAAAPALAVWTPLVALNLAGAFGAVLGVGLIARRLGADRRGARVAMVLAILGCAPLFWALPVLHALAGDAAPLRALAAGGVAPYYEALNRFTLHVSLVFFGDKFLLPTPFAPGLAAFAALVLALIDAIQRPGPRTAATLAAVEAAALFVHVVVGASGALLAGAWWAWAAWRSRGPRGRPLREALLPVAGAFAAAVVALSPYLLATLAGRRGGAAFAPSTAALTTWLLVGGLFVPPGLLWLWRRRSDDVPRELLGLALILSAAGLALALPNHNESKFFNLLFLLLAAPAALAWLEVHDRLPRRARPWLVAALALAVVPGNLLALRAHVMERARHARAWQRPLSAAERAGWAAVRGRTPRDAVFVDTEAELHATVLARRSVLWGGAEWESNWGYPPAELALRRAAVEAFRSGAPLPPAAAALLAGLGREVVVVAHGAGGRGLAAPPGCRPLFANSEIAFFRWEPAP